MEEIQAYVDKRAEQREGRVTKLSTGFRVAAGEMEPRHIPAQTRLFPWKRASIRLQQYHNYFREHDALEGKTPAEAANIKIKGRNKSVTVIQNASKMQN